MMNLAPGKDSKWMHIFLNFKNVSSECFFARVHRTQLTPSLSDVGLWKRDEKGNRSGRELRRGIVWWKWNKHTPKYVKDRLND